MSGNKGQLVATARVEPLQVPVSQWVARQPKRSTRTIPCFAKQKVSFAKQKVSFAKQKVSFAKQKVSFAKQKVSFAKQKVSFAKQKVSYAEQKRCSAEPKLAPDSEFTGQQLRSTGESRLRSICLIRETNVFVNRISKLAGERTRTAIENGQFLSG